MFSSSVQQIVVILLTIQALQDFNVLVWKSRTVAGNAEGSVRLLLEEILPALQNAAVTAESKIELMEAQKKVSSLVAQYVTSSFFFLIPR